MKKPIFLYLALSLIINSCSDNKTKTTDWEKFNLNGPVKSVKSSLYRATRNGDKIQKSYEITGSYTKYDPLLFNENGQLIEKGFAFTMEIEKTVYKYDDNGNRIEESTYGPSAFLLYKDVYEYENRKKIKGKQYDSDGSLASKSTYEYDDDGNLIKEIYYGPNGMIYLRIIHKYDKNGNEIEKNRIDSNGALMSKETYKYDNDGNRIEKSTYDESDGSVYENWVYEYNNNGNIIKKIYKTDGDLFSTTTYKYNDEGNKIEENWYDGDDPLEMHYRYIYIYDKKGNWIKNTIIRDGFPKSIVEREIKYFKAN